MLNRSKTRTRPYVRLTAKSALKRAQGRSGGNGADSVEKPARGLKRGRIKAKPGLTDTQKADRAFSLIIREAAGWVCARCHKDHSEHHETLDCSHYWNVRYYAVRYDPDNADALCHFPCHVGVAVGWEYEKSEDGPYSKDGTYTKFIKRKLTLDGFYTLKGKSNQHIKLREAREAFWEGRKGAAKASYER